MRSGSSSATLAALTALAGLAAVTAVGGSKMVSHLGHLIFFPGGTGSWRFRIVLHLGQVYWCMAVVPKSRADENGACFDIAYTAPAGTAMRYLSSRRQFAQIRVVAPRSPANPPS